MARDERQPIIIKKVKKNRGGDAHHGGAWKVAYADFVTAMMAFFLLLWLLNVTTDEQKALISSYFSPADPRVSRSESGSGGVMGGKSLEEGGSMTEFAQPLVTQPGKPDAAGEEDGRNDNLDNVGDDALKAEMEKRDKERFKAVEQQLKQAIQTNPDLKELAQNLMIDQTPEGLRIQIVDQEGKPMFPLGSAEPLPAARKLLLLIADVIEAQPNRVSIRGHTDSRPYGPGATYTNWELSADRANASRRVILQGGLEIERVENVMGKADREHLLPDDPYSARNRRISIILLRESLVPGVYDKEKRETGRDGAKSGDGENDGPQLRRREEGIIYFP